MKKHPIQHASGSFSRRDFLRVSGITALTVGGMTVLTACGPAAQSSDASASSATTTSAGSDTSSSDSLKLGDGKTLRVGMEAAYAPYNWQESSASDTTIPIENVDGAYADGYDVQVAKKIADALGMEPVAVKMEFGSLVDSLVNGQIDIICAGMSVTDERAQSADFSDSYIDDEVIMVVKQDSPYANATKLSDFSGASVLGQKDTFYDDLIDQIPNVKPPHAGGNRAAGGRRSYERYLRCHYLLVPLASAPAEGLSHPQEG
ncbi:transporter substrate-binding domain-containing protein [Olsenella sp. AF21-51]|uniref:transporter substrate-binding domain-containing protein n=1 Tax=Olsenella sp. AF21-51 TaxID=2292239 RepID=UPI002570B69D|nr:transporter substrate-binding domain-containing protein [Olsenella sp. AF21-51]